MRSFYEAVETLTNKDKPRMYEAIIKYSFEDNYEPNFKGTLATVWLLIKPILDNSFKQYKMVAKIIPIIRLALIWL